MDLPMAAKKTRKSSKKPRSKVAKPVRRPGRTATKKRTPARAKARVKRIAAKTKARKGVAKRAKPKQRPAAKKRPAPARPKAQKRAPAPRPAGKTARAAPAGARPDHDGGPVSEKKAPRAPSSRPPGSASKALADRGSQPGTPGLKPLSKDRPSLRSAGKPLSPKAPLREAPPRLVSLPLPILAPPKRPSVEERAAQIDSRLMAQTEEFRKRYEESLDMSWIYHDSALEGVVYTFEELRAALIGRDGGHPPAPGQPPPVTDSSLQPTYDDIRRHKEAIEYVRAFGQRKNLPITVDTVKKIYLILHPEEGDIKTVKYRKDIPQHRLYFHEYAPPDKIAYKVRQIVDWLNDPETRKTRNGIRIAARAHYDMLRVYPFPTDSGKVARLFMNLMLMRTGLPPAIIHSTERQRYYEALKGSATTVLQMVQEAVENALSSVEKLLDEHETKKRAFVS
jgi:Fic family protein